MGYGSKGSEAFVGRDGPRARIRAALRDPFAGEARLVLVSGEAGIGKTALLTEATREAGGAGATTVWGTCWDADRAPGYWPWAQVVRQMLERAGAEILDSEHCGRSVRLRDAKGLHDLAALLSRPGEEIHVLDLAGSAIRGRGSTVPVLDSRARAEFKRRITDLDEDLAEAEARHDLGRVERIENEREALLDELRRATGHAGKDRGLGPNTVERARKAVTARLRDTIGRIEAVLPELGSHLDRSIVTGTYCRYQPAEPLTWDLQVGTTL